MDSIKSFIENPKESIYLISMTIFIIGLISTLITFFVSMGENNKLRTELTPDKYKIVKKNIENSRLAMYILLGISVFFGIVASTIPYIIKYFN
jgi:formate hydrogenlyase subunit 3/multisubunit Na+/H+ antiporter MnhD subunit